LAVLLAVNPVVRTTLIYSGVLIVTSQASFT